MEQSICLMKCGGTTHSIASHVISLSCNFTDAYSWCLNSHMDEIFHIILSIIGDYTDAFSDL